MRTTRWWRIFAILMALSLVAAACGDDDDETTTDTTDDTGDTGGDGGSGDGEEISLDEEIEVAEGTVLPLPDCPGDWDPMAGLTDDTITVGMSLPESGPVAALGGLDDGMQAWFRPDEPIDGAHHRGGRAGRRLRPRTHGQQHRRPPRDGGALRVHLRGRDPRTTWRSERPSTRSAFHSCSTRPVSPGWGDPAEFPWTVGGLLGYNTEAELWCNYVNDEVGEDATVAGPVHGQRLRPRLRRDGAELRRRGFDRPDRIGPATIPPHPT